MKKLVIVSPNETSFIYKLSATYFKVSKVKDEEKKQEELQGQKKKSLSLKSFSKTFKFNKNSKKYSEEGEITKKEDQKENERNFPKKANETRETPTATLITSALGFESARKIQSQIRTENNFKTTQTITESQKSKNDQDFCIVCYEKESSCIFLPCGHGGMCTECAEQIWRKTGECLFCKAVSINSLENPS